MDEAVEVILKRIRFMFAKQEKRIYILDADLLHIERRISDLEYDTPTQKELDEYNSRVDKYHPLT